MNNKVSSRKMIIRNLFYVLFTGVVLLCFASSSFAWTWEQQQTRLGDGGVIQKIVRDGAGNALAVYDSNDGLRRNRYFRDSGWAASGIMFAPNGLYDFPSPNFDVAMNKDGDYIVAVIVTDAVPDLFSNPRIKAYLSIDGHITISSNVPKPTADPNWKVAISENNDALVVWENGNDIRYRMYRGGTWGTDSVLDSSTSGVTSSSMDVATDELGNFIVVWNRQNATDGRKIYGRRFLNGTWSARETIGQSGTTAREGFPQATMYGNGQAIVVWEHHFADSTGIYARRFNGSNWLAPQGIDTGISAGVLSRRPHIASQQDGTAMVIFKQGAGASFKIYANRFSEGVWDGAEEIGCDVAGQNFNIDMDGNGNAAAAFAATNYFVFRSYQAGLGWLGCSYQGWGNYISGSSTDIEKRVVITPHEILGVWPKQEQFGIGVYSAKGKKDVYINGFDVETESPIVDLDITLPYNSICGDTSPWLFQEMRFSNNGTDWSPWEPAPTTDPYTTTKSSWNLTNTSYGGNSDPGLKRVYIQFRNEICDSLVTHDEINYHPLIDADGDGYSPPDDCDDSDNTVYPGAHEVCDGKDNDCDGQTDEGLSTDVDGDGHYAPGSCIEPADDCDDSDNTVYPGAPEVCDGKDNDCDGQVDEGLSTDADGDGHYAPGSCIEPADDCDDNDNTVYPGALEVCDSKDNDCDGQVDEGLSTDVDGDGHYAPGSCIEPADDCDDSDNTVYPGAPELCDSKDNDCNGATTDGSDESWYGDPTSCGIGVCENEGQFICSGGNRVDTCTPGTPTETPESSCSDGLDNDCDGDTDCNDSDCCNTPEGSDVTVEDDTGQVTVTFPEVTEGGETEIFAEGCQPGQEPEGFGLTQIDPLCVQVETDAQWDGDVEICITYDETGVDERYLAMVRCPDGDPNNCVLLDPCEPDNSDTDENILCACTDRFSYFAAGTPLDSDEDGTPDLLDNCPHVKNWFQEDADEDGIGDACDNCPNFHDPTNICADACMGDFDNDGDIDGSDLAVFAVGGTTITLEEFSTDFGRTNCP